MRGGRSDYAGGDVVYMEACRKSEVYKNAKGGSTGGGRWMQGTLSMDGLV